MSTYPINLLPREWYALPDVDNFLLTNVNHHDLYLWVGSPPSTADITSQYGHVLLPRASANKIGSGINYVLSPQGGQIAWTEISCECGGSISGAVPAEPSPYVPDPSLTITGSFDESDPFSLLININEATGGSGTYTDYSVTLDFVDADDAPRSVTVNGLLNDPPSATGFSGTMANIIIDNATADVYRVVNIDITVIDDTGATATESL